MAKNKSASVKRREEALARALAKKKKDRILLIVSVILALAVIAATVAIIILTRPEEPAPVPPTKHLADDVYEETDEVTNFVKLNISYRDADGIERIDDIVIELDPENAPITVANFQKLVKEDFYSGLIFHRAVDGFMIQGGGYDTKGNKKEADTIKGEFSDNGVDNGIKHVRGTISMARVSGQNDSASSEFFIVHETSDDNTKSLDGKYAGFGWVLFGMETVDRIAVLETSSEILTTNVIINSATFVKEIEK